MTPIGKSLLLTIRTKDEWVAAITEVEALWDAQPGTPEHDRLKDLGRAVSEYEDQVFRSFSTESSH